MTTVSNRPTLRDRLEPEWTLLELENRAAKATEYCHEAIAALDWARLERAYARLLQRWGEWDSTAPASEPRRLVLQGRAETLMGLLETVRQESAAFERVLGLFYYYTRLAEAHTDPPSRTDVFDAAAWADRRMAVWRETGER